MKINYNQLYYFHVLAATGSLKLASEELGTTASTISEHIKNLEKYFGKSLFNKSGGKLKLNSFGQHIFLYSTSIFDASERLIQSLSPNKKSIVKSLLIDTTPFVLEICPNEIMTPVISQKFSLKVNQSDFVDALKKLYAFETDIVIATEGALPKGMKNITKSKIRDINFYCVCSKELISDKKKYTFKDLAHLDHIAYSHNSLIRYSSDAFFQKHDLSPKLVIETDGINLIRNATNEGLGFSFLPETIVNDNDHCIVKIFKSSIFKVPVYAYSVENDKRAIVSETIGLLKKAKK